MAISRRLLEETGLIQPGIWNEPMQRVICPTLVRLSGRDCCTCIVVHPHTALPCLCRERENASIRLLPNRTGVPSSTALSLFLSRPLHPVNRSLLGGSPVLRRVNANFTRSITFSTWIIRYSWRACAPTRGVTFQADRSRGRISNNASL